jgi:hypothetical protein
MRILHKRLPDVMFLLSLVCGLALPLAAQHAVPQITDTLSGDLPDVVESRGGAFYVKSDIVVPPGRTVVVKPGSILLFKNFTGLQVQGVLLARGSKEHPVIFTSENDDRRGATSGVAPAPYDWNGITVHESAPGTAFEYCGVFYSLFGINALTPDVTFRQCRFGSNGKADLTLAGVKQTVGSAPFSFGLTPTAPPSATSAVPADVSRRVGLRVGFRISGVALLLAGGAVGAWQGWEYRSSRREFNRLNDRSAPENLANPNIITDWEQARLARDNNLYRMIAGAGVAALGLTGFGISFAW